MTETPQHRWYLRPFWICLAGVLVATFAFTIGGYAWQRVATLEWIDRTDGHVEFRAPPRWVPEPLVAFWPQWALPVDEIRLLDVTGNALDRLKMFREVRGLELSGTAVTDADLVILAHCRSLKRLDLSDTAVGDEGVKHLAGLPLESLDLSGTRVTDAGMGAIRECKRLEVLRLNGTSVGDAGLAQLRGLPLSILRLSGTRVTDAGLTALGPLPHLEWLDLNETTVGNSGLTAIATCPRLQCLHLMKTHITDAGLVHLQKLPLFSLDLSGTAVGDAGLEYLPVRAGWTNIELGDTAVTQSAAENLATALGLKVSQDSEGHLWLSPDQPEVHYIPAD